MGARERGIRGKQNCFYPAGNNRNEIPRPWRPDCPKFGFKYLRSSKLYTKTQKIEFWAFYAFATI